MATQKEGDQRTWHVDLQEETWTKGFQYSWKKIKGTRHSWTRLYSTDSDKAVDII